MKFVVRKYLLPLHRWTGLTVGLVIVLMAVTGASMLFRPQLEPMLNRDLVTVATCADRVPLDTLTANARAVYAAAEPDYIRILAGTEAAVRMPAARIHFTDQQFVYLNPCTGTVLGQENRYSGFFGSILRLHRLRFLPIPSLATGTAGLLFGTVLICGGVFMWWPATRQGWQNAVKFHSRLAGPARTLKHHKTVGFYASLIVLTSVLTGLPQDLEWYKNVIYSATGSAPPVPAPTSTIPGGAQRLSMESLWQRAQSLVPHPSDALLRYPRKPDAAVDMILIAHDAPHPNARTMLFLDAYSGKVLRLTPYATSSLGHKLYFWTFSWHTGLIGGLFGQLLLMVGALSVPVLAFTGIGSYLRPKLRAPVAGRQ